MKAQNDKLRQMLTQAQAQAQREANGAAEATAQMEEQMRQAKNVRSAFAMLQRAVTSLENNIDAFGVTSDSSRLALVPPPQTTTPATAAANP
mmetsp:Transcript_2330/g.8547  ORF Transcript_2330/g.8547 Transcript_2330/m.8547 type:complete len:92 (-) Transcript_2330:3878-4153(-)